MPKPNARPPGQLRHSQVVTTFGPGSLLDLPTVSVIVGGLGSIDFTNAARRAVCAGAFGQAAAFGSSLM